MLWIPWNYTALAAIVPSVALSISMFFMPESPNWLMSKFGRSLKVVESMHRLRHFESDIDQELNEVEEITLARKANNTQSFSYKMLSQQDVYKPMLIAVGLLFFQQFSGMNALQFYMADFFKDSGSSLKPSIAVIVVNTVMLLATIGGGVLVDRLGRRIMLSLSGLCHSTSLAVLGYYYYKHRTGDSIAPNTTPFSIISSTIANTSTLSSHFCQHRRKHMSRVLYRLYVWWCSSPVSVWATDRSFGST